MKRSYIYQDISEPKNKYKCNNIKTTIHNNNYILQNTIFINCDVNIHSCIIIQSNCNRIRIHISTDLIHINCVVNIVNMILCNDIPGEYGIYYDADDNVISYTILCN
jgi:hypothetical protein